MCAFYAAASALIERDGTYLMIKEGKSYVHGKWAIPGGGIEHGENPVEAVKREIKEETGLESDIEKLLTVLTGKDDGDGHPAFVFVFRAEVEEGKPSPVKDKEILEAEFKSLKEIEELDLRNDELEKALKAEESGYELDVNAFDKFVNY